MLKCLFLSKSLILPSQELYYFIKVLKYLIIIYINYFIIINIVY